MSTLLKQMAIVRCVIDNDCGMHTRGEVEGAFNPEELNEFLNQHGEFGFHQLLTTLSYLQYQVYDAWRSGNRQGVGRDTKAST